MAVSESDVDAFMARVVALFSPWQTIAGSSKSIQGPPHGQQYWHVVVDTNGPMELDRSEVVGSNLVIRGGPAMERSEPPIWAPKPDFDHFDHTEATAPLPSSVDPLLVNTTFTDGHDNLVIDIPINAGWTQ